MVNIVTIDVESIYVHLPEFICLRCGKKRDHLPSYFLFLDPMDELRLNLFFFLNKVEREMFFNFKYTTTVFFYFI